MAATQAQLTGVGLPTQIEHEVIPGRCSTQVPQKYSKEYIGKLLGTNEHREEIVSILKELQTAATEDAPKNAELLSKRIEDPTSLINSLLLSLLREGEQIQQLVQSLEYITARSMITAVDKQSLPSTKESFERVTPRYSEMTQYGATVPQFGTTGQQYGTTWPQSGSIVPQFGSTVPQFGTTVPQFGSTVPQFGSTVSQFGSTVPQYGATVPQEGSQMTQYGSQGGTYGPNVGVYGSDGEIYNSMLPLYHSSILGPPQYPTIGDLSYVPERACVSPNIRDYQSDGLYRTRSSFLQTPQGRSSFSGFATQSDDIMEANWRSSEISEARRATLSGKIPGENDLDRIVYLSWIPRVARAQSKADKLYKQSAMLLLLHTKLGITSVTKVLLFPPRGNHAKFVFRTRLTAQRFLDMYGGQQNSEATEKFKWRLCNAYNLTKSEEHIQQGDQQQGDQLQGDQLQGDQLQGDQQQGGQQPEGIIDKREFIEPIRDAHISIAWCYSPDFVTQVLAHRKRLYGQKAQR